MTKKREKEDRIKDERVSGMYLQEHDVKRITKGALSVTVEEGRYQFYRFEEAELAQLSDEKDHYRKMCASSGIRFDFQTDADVFEFQYQVFQASSRNFYYFDVCVDGELYQHTGEEGVVESAGHMQIPLPGGIRRVTVYFPCLFRASVWDLQLTGGSGMCREWTYKRRLLSLGDSITQGYDARFPSMTYPARLAEFLQGEFVNQGVGSDVFCPEHLSRLRDYHPDVITIAYGTNDWSVKESFSRFGEECQEYMERMKMLYPGCRAVVITPLWRKGGDRVSAVGTMESVIDRIRSIWKSYPHVFLVDGRKLVPHLPEFFDDGALHPNDLGFTLYARNLIDLLKEADYR